MFGECWRVGESPFDNRWHTSPSKQHNPDNQERDSNCYSYLLSVVGMTSLKDKGSSIGHMKDYCE